MHELEVERDPLQKQLANIEQIFQEFADQYDEAARSLRNGLVPDPIPSIQLEAARKVVTDTYAAISEAGQPFGMEPLDNNSSLFQAGDYLMLVVEARAKAERERQMVEDARLVIHAVDALVHQSEPEVLNQLKTSSQNLLQELEDGNLETAESLISGEHPLAMLAAYTQHRNTLNDEEYDTFRDAIQENYGRALLRDIDRGRVVLNQTAVDAAPVALQAERPVDLSSENNDFEENDFEEGDLEVGGFQTNGFAGSYQSADIESDDDADELSALEIDSDIEDAIDAAVEESNESSAEGAAADMSEFSGEFADEISTEEVSAEFDDQEESTIIETEVYQDASSYDPISEIEIDEELLEEANIDITDEELPPLYNDFENGDAEDTLLPFLEGDGMHFGGDEMPEATVNQSEEEQDENEDEPEDLY